MPGPSGNDDNRANQMNPNNDAYWQSRDHDERPDDWEDQVPDEDSANDDNAGQPTESITTMPTIPLATHSDPINRPAEHTSKRPCGAPGNVSYNSRYRTRCPGAVMALQNSLLPRRRPAEPDLLPARPVT